MTRSDTLAETMQSLPHPRKAAPNALRRMIAAVAALATALSLLAATAVPAKAGNDDLAKALAAIAAIGIIASVAKQGRADHRDNRWDNPVDHRAGRDWPPRHDQTRTSRVPASCAIMIQGNRHSATVYGERCLRREGFNRLPQHCARNVRIYGRADRVYSEQCLRQAGYRIGRSRN